MLEGARRSDGFAAIQILSERKIPLGAAGRYLFQPTDRV